MTVSSVVLARPDVSAKWAATSRTVMAGWSATYCKTLSSRCPSGSFGGVIGQLLDYARRHNTADYAGSQPKKAKILRSPIDGSLAEELAFRESCRWIVR